MMTTQDLTRRYRFLIDTLKMLCIDFTSIKDEEIEECLEELEGDYYSFLDYNALLPLVEGSILDDEHVKRIVVLKDMIRNIPPTLWNKDAFKVAKQWNDVRVLANKILLEQLNKVR